MFRRHGVRGRILILDIDDEYCDLNYVEFGINLELPFLRLLHVNLFAAISSSHITCG